MTSFLSDADKLKVSIRKLPSSHAGAAGLKAQNVLYAVTDVRDGRRIGEVELSRNHRFWEYLEKYPNGKKARQIVYLIAALDTPELLDQLKAQYEQADSDTDAPCVILPDGTRVPYYLPNENAATPEDVASAVLRALLNLRKAPREAESNRVNIAKQLQRENHALKIDIRYEPEGGLWDAVMQDPEYQAILNEFANDPTQTSAPVIVLSADYGNDADKSVQFIRSPAVEQETWEPHP